MCQGDVGWNLDTTADVDPRVMRSAAMPWCCAVAVLCGVAAVAAAQDDRPRDDLPLVRVRLYETGVGYFERSGRLGPRTRLRLPRSHLDDALKSLVVLGAAGQGTFEGVSFETLVSESLGRALARLPTESESPVDLEQLAASLTGDAVEVRVAGARHRGTLLQVVSAEDSSLERCVLASATGASNAPAGREARPASAPCLLRKRPSLLLLGEDGVLARFGLDAVDGVRPLQKADADRLHAAFGSSADAARADHPLRLTGALSGRVTLGYIAEAPLWRTSYRLVRTDAGAQLQAWALLHNDTEEAWDGVEVELVNGQPDSFLFPLAAPRYAHRRLVTPETELPSVPQLLSRGADELWDRGELYDISTVGHGYGAGAGGFRGRSARVPRIRSGAAEESSLLAVGDLAAHADARAEEIGALFRYTVPQAVHLEPHRSLLVPILRAPVEATRVSYFADDESSAQSALLFENTTRQTLPAGTVAVFEDGGFGGESAIDRLKPHQKRLLAYGVDLDVELDGLSRRVSERPGSLRFLGGDLIEHFVRVEDREYELHNRSTTSRTVHLALDVVNNAKVERADAVHVSEDAEGDTTVSAVWEIAGEATRRAQLHVEQGLSRRRSLEKLTSHKLAALADDSHLDAEQRGVLATARDHLRARERLRRRAKALQSEISLLERRVARARQNIVLVAKADRERAAALAASLVRDEERIAALERTRAGLRPDARLQAAASALRGLNRLD